MSGQRICERSLVRVVLAVAVSAVVAEAPAAAAAAVVVVAQVVVQGSESPYFGLQ